MHMYPWWVTLESGGGYSIEAPDHNAAMVTANTARKKGNVIVRVDRLPHPAAPNRAPSPDSISFCTTPTRCAGCTACPNRPACTE